MPIQSVSLQSIRSHALATFSFDPNITLILGQNGTGKTTILEAVHLLMRGTSFRGRDRDVLAHGNDRAVLKLVIDEGERRSTLLLTDDKLQKEFVVGDKKSSRLATQHRLPVVLFEPDELRLLTSSPQRRRDFIDGVISRISPTYSAVLSRYARTLLQRNELLKQLETMNQSDWESHLFAWDVKLAELGATIIKARINFIEHSNLHLSRIYSSVAGHDHVVKARYIGSSSDNLEGLQQHLLHRLETSRKLDALRGNTSVGPHRDDMELELDGHPASEAASRGELRTIMLAFKLLEVELQEHHSGQKPLILLDDVFSELDTTREQQLMNALHGYQTIITATDLRDELKIDATVISL